MSFRISMVFRPSYFSILCYFGLLDISLYYVIETFGISFLCYFNLLTFQQKLIRPVGHFAYLSFRTWDFSALCHFELLWYIDLLTFHYKSFRPLYFSFLYYFDLWTLHEMSIRTFLDFGLSYQCNFELGTFWFYRISILNGISTFVPFDPMLFRPLDISL